MKAKCMAAWIVLRGLQRKAGMIVASIVRHDQASLLRGQTIGGSKPSGRGSKPSEKPSEKPSGNHRETIGKPSGNHRETIGKPSGNHRETVGKPSGGNRRGHSTLTDARYDNAVSPEDQKAPVSPEDLRKPPEDPCPQKTHSRQLPSNIDSENCVSMERFAISSIISVACTSIRRKLFFDKGDFIRLLLVSLLQQFFVSFR